jgi:hypothetical protein
VQDFKKETAKDAKKKKNADKTALKELSHEIETGCWW